MTMSDLDRAISDHAEGSVLAVVVTPRAGKTGLDRVEADAVRIRLAAPPVDGAANAALLRYLAWLFGRPRSSFQLLSGATGRRKRVLLAGVTRAGAIVRLRELLGEPPS